VTWQTRAPQVALLVSLDATTAAGGAVRVLPGSHRTSTDLHAVLPSTHAAAGAPPPDDPALADRPEQVTIEARPGDAVLLDYRVLHGTHPHDGVDVRRALILNFAPSWRTLPVEIRAHLIAGCALPGPDESVPRSFAGVLPAFAGEQRDLALSRDAPISFAR
jgi:ectoine hydroxylase-related dioxygenase (phytanoyl-CoA dioxygenase family)